jgi:hypothetical protein
MEGSGVRARLQFKPAKESDLASYVALQRESWGDDLAVEEKKARHRFEHCLNSILIAFHEGRPVGTSTQIRLPSYDIENPPTWYEATGDGWCDTHVNDGPICFGVDLSVARDHPRGTVDAIAAASMQLAIRLGVKFYILGGRMPLYHRYASEYSPDEYIVARDPEGSLLDPQVGMYAKIPGLAIVRAIPDYFDDPESLDHGVLLRWRNPFYRLPGRNLLSHLPVVAYNQWQRYEDHLVRSRVPRAETPTT